MKYGNEYTGEHDFPIAFSSERAHDDTRGPVVSVAEYRELLADQTSSDEDISRRLQYLEALCRCIIQEELRKYVNEEN